MKKSHNTNTNIKHKINIPQPPRIRRLRSQHPTQPILIAPPQRIPHEMHSGISVLDHIILLRGGAESAVSAFARRIDPSCCGGGECMQHGGLGR